MRRLLLILGLLLVAVALALFAKFDSGYVLLSWGKWTVETSVSFFIILGAVLFTLTYYLGKVVRAILRTPGGLAAWWRRRHARKAHVLEQHAHIAYAEGRWRDAEHLFDKAARISVSPMVDYLGAARAAQKQWRYEDRDRYLAQAHLALPEADIAVGLTQAELQLSHGQLEQALATLIRLRQVQPHHSYILHLLLRVYEQLNSWGDVAALLPDLRRYKVLPKERLEGLEREAYTHLMDLALKLGSAKRLQEFWQELPKHLRGEDGFIVPYGRALVEQRLHDEAEELLRQVLKSRWSPALMHVYGLVVFSQPAKQLAFAESFLKKYPRDAVLLLSLGRICLHVRLWGKARSYLEASLAQAPRGETYRELATLLEQLGMKDAAHDYYRRGLDLLLDDIECTTFHLTPEERKEALPAGKAK